ncbi:hypothetical protein N9L06_04750 [Mariniblastus sp.]|nr:hypothetical protein [Mariniblastus sp.]
MANPIRLEVYQTSLVDENQLLYETDVMLPIRIGRQEKGRFPGVWLDDQDDARTTLGPDRGSGDHLRKLFIAAPDERAYSRRFAELSYVNDSVEVRNTSSNQPIFLGAQNPIEPSESRCVALPVELTMGERMISLAPVGQVDPQPAIRTLAPNAPPTPIGTSNWGSTMEFNVVSLKGAQKGTKFDGERLIELLRTIMQMLQESPSSSEFYDNACRAIGQLLELDNCLILFRDGYKPPFGKLEASFRDWHAQSSFPLMREESEYSPSLKILDFVRKEKQTVYQIPDVRSASLVGVSSLVASPLKNSHDEVIGIIYGDRRFSVQAMFSEMEATFVDLFANGISVGLERMGHEREISDMRARFDQFFTPSVARQLEADPTMLEPRSADVSVLFADIRGFSRISERIGPDGTIRWINSVMSHLSDSVLDHDGVVVDYVGDEIMAMWGAPLEQENHAQLAVEAALDMVSKLPQINQEWESIVGEPVDFGVGINSGEAQVGNTGSSKKFKYGPLGDVVNVSSRIQSASKQMRSRMLIADATESQLPPEFARRKLRSVRFVNVERAVGVYELKSNADENWQKLKQEYETGLALYDSGQLAQAIELMASIINRWPKDQPSMMLLSDAVIALQRNEKEFEPVWQLVQK